MFKLALVLFAVPFLVGAMANPLLDLAEMDSIEDQEKTFNRLNNMISVVQQNLLSKTEKITAKGSKTTLSEEDIAKVSKLRKRYESLENFRRLLIQQKQEQQQSKKRYQECIRSLGKAICDQNTTFYLWAQMLAKDILGRPDVA